ncbi:MAG: AIR synthase-related protein [Thaumarchaeota archaeon]|nr:AIR synthase-related protein [Nitrososphaerota archaeon]
MKLARGKLTPEMLSEFVFSKTGEESRDLVLKPGIGIDVGVVKLGRRFLIVKSDPVTGVLDDVGRYAVIVSANDVATTGNRPKFMQSVVLFPERSTTKDVKRVTSQVANTAKELGITIVGGHTELTPGLPRVIVVTTAFAVAETFISSADAREGDSLLMTKVSGLEGTAIIASEPERFGLKVEHSILTRAKSFAKDLSIVEEAVAAYGTGAVHAMHDCTEGGVLGAAYEMSFAARLGVELVEKNIPVAQETNIICKALGIDPLKLISSGTLLLAVETGREPRVRKALAALRIDVSRIGVFRRGPSVLIRRDGKRETITTAPTDELWRLSEQVSRP